MRRRRGGGSGGGAPAGPVATGAFGLLYQQDFSLLPNQPLVPGANIIGGQRWWVKGTVVDPGEAAQVVSGVGLRILQSAITSWSYAGGALPPCPMLAFADLPKYDPNAALLVQYRFQEVDLRFPSNVLPHGDLVTATGNANVITDAERTGAHGSLYDKNSGQWRFQYGLGGTGGWNSTPAVAAGPQTGVANLQVLELFSPGALRCQHFALSSQAGATSWPNVNEAAQNTGFVIAGAPRGPSAAPSQGFAFWGENHVGTALGLMTHSLRAIRVYQTGA